MVKKFDGKGEVDPSTAEGGLPVGIHHFDNILVGMSVARVYPPKNGIDGQDAVGKKIAAKPGKPARFSFDAATLSLQQKGDEYQSLVALREGYLGEDSGKYRISDTLTVRGNLDRHYGNMEFIGKLVISGNVMPGILVRGKTGVEILGETRECVISSAQGDIKLGGFCYGGEEASIRCAGTLNATILQAANIETGGDICISKEAIDCKLKSARAVFLPQGKLIGGETFVVDGLEAGFIGNEANKRTIIRVCSNVEATVEYARLVLDLETHEKAMKLLELHLGPIANDSSRLKKLAGPNREKLEKLVAKLAEVRRSRIELLARQKRMLESARFASGARINFARMLYAGVILEAGNLQFVVKDDTPGPGTIEYNAEERKFVAGPHKPLSAPKDSKK
jgi:uncharacterized protein (DUF342 family)